MWGGDRGWQRAGRKAGKQYRCKFGRGRTPERRMTDRILGGDDGAIEEIGRARVDQTKGRRREGLRPQPRWQHTVESTEGGSMVEEFEVEMESQ